MPPSSPDLPGLLVPERLSTLRAKLLGWYDANRRELPWRSSGDAYHVWVSEIMLQQTQVATVVPYYERFLERFPNLPALAEAPEEEVLRQWAGLGYYSRARNLHRAAQAVVREHDGVFPRQMVDARALPGVGRYTAGAVLSIAYDQPVPLVDGNVARVLCRAFERYGDPSRNPTREELWRIAGSLVSSIRPGDLNQALMELGATVCTPSNPACHRCPLQDLCLARQNGKVARLPQQRESPTLVPVEMVAAVALRDGHALLARPREAARWRGLWQFPHSELPQDDSYIQTAELCLRTWTGLGGHQWRHLVTLKHGITRFRITLRAYAGSVTGRGEPKPGETTWRWIPLAELAAAGLPAPHRRVAEALLAPQAASEEPLG
ncbi:MAG TPA: A/G-specific adenine glycosylase [Armatimonadota bacterium]|jgi:A/G-specific adenine glycosylase